MTPGQHSSPSLLPGAAAAPLLQTIHPEPAVTAGGRTVAATKIGGNAVLITVRGGRTRCSAPISCGRSIRPGGPFTAVLCCVAAAPSCDSQKTNLAGVRGDAAGSRARRAGQPWLGAGDRCSGAVTSPSSPAPQQHLLLNTTPQ